MRKIIPCTLLVLLLSFGSAEGLAQEKSYITVEGSKRNNGVVLLDISKAGKSYLLQCNQGAPGCAALNNGKYQMVELPQNFGMYECKDKDVEVYAEEDNSRQEKLGEYCLLEKQ
ncbi:MAG: hypothetical protein WA741_10540 [Candidatus Sulfotelmatobacter sp.]